MSLLPATFRHRTFGALVLLAAGLAVACALLFLLAGCGSSSSRADSAGKLRVVAAENIWGSIAQQIGGDRVAVTSLIANPNVDPHDYEPTTKDGRAVANAEYVIVNGIGYDGWVEKLLAANPRSGRRVLNIGELLGLKEGDNPHQWYAPASVEKVAARIAEDYVQLDPAGSSYFAQQRDHFLNEGLATYHALIAEIRQRYAGTPVGASESIFAPLAQALGLNLITPPSFLDAISEGAEPSAQDKATVDQQIKSRQIKVYVYNSQNATPDVQNLVAEAKAAGIPVVTITETPTPASAKFQDWQSAQLRALEVALAQATREVTP